MYLNYKLIFIKCDLIEKKNRLHNEYDYEYDIFKF